MIDNSQTSNIKPTDEQAAQLEQYEIKLSNLLSEITNATKILKGTKIESDRAVKERAYQEELLAELTPKVEEKRKQLDGFNEEINKATSALSKLQEEIRIKSEEQIAKDYVFQSKSDELERQIAEYNTKTAQSNRREASLQKNEILFNQKVAKLKEVISTF